MNKITANQSFNFGSSRLLDGIGIPKETSDLLPIDGYISVTKIDIQQEIIVFEPDFLESTEVHVLQN